METVGVMVLVGPSSLGTCLVHKALVSTASKVLKALEARGFKFRTCKLGRKNSKLILKSMNLRHLSN